MLGSMKESAVSSQFESNAVSHGGVAVLRVWGSYLLGLVALTAVACDMMPIDAGVAATAFAPAPIALGAPAARDGGALPLVTSDETCRDRAAAPRQFAQLTAPQSGTPESVGVVSSLQGSATVTRNGADVALRIQDDIFKGDVLRTAPASTLGVIFDDETTFSLTANASIVVDDFLYQEGGDKNVATFKFAQGTVAFVASAVAKTGNMTLSTPAATMGIRGTTGLVDVGQSSGASGTDAIKLYPDADGKVGRIEISSRDGAALGVLTRGATGFAIQRGTGGRVVATPLQISPQQAARDQTLVRQVHAERQRGQALVAQRRATRQRGPGRQPGIRNGVRPNAPQPPGAEKPAIQKPAVQHRGGGAAAPPKARPNRGKPRR